MNDERKDTPGGMDPGDDEALWQLLGRAPGVEPGPYFSRRVLREATLAGEKPARAGGWLASLRGAWRRPRAAVWPGAVVVGVFWLSVVLTTNTPVTGGGAHRAPSARMPLAQAAPAAALVSGDVPVPAAFVTADDVAPQDVEVIADLDNMISREENRLWTEDTARF